MSIQDLIAARGASLTPTERRIATVVLDDPTRLAFGTAADLAHLAQTSAPSVVRFAAKLGFDGYSALQSWAQEGVSRQLSSPSERIRHHDERAALRAGVESAVSRVFEALSPERLATLAAPIAQARNVYILTGETSTAGARVLHSGLSMIRPSVTLVMEHSTGRDLAGAARGDACIVFDFARYRRSSVTSARTLRRDRRRSRRHHGRPALTARRTHPSLVRAEDSRGRPLRQLGPRGHRRRTACGANSRRARRNNP